MSMPTVSSHPADSDAPWMVPGNSALEISDRRRAVRIKKKFITQMTPWAPGHASVPFEVVINDISDTGIGVIHDEPLEIGLRHLLSVPREGVKSVVEEFVIVRCERKGENQYQIGLERAAFTSARTEELPRKWRVSKRLKTLFLLFGIFGLLIASLAPL